MYPDDSTMFNQLGDDRDHTYLGSDHDRQLRLRLGKGRERPVYPCTGKPQGLFADENRSTGYASTAGKMAAAFALGARLFAERDRAFADTLRHKAIAAYALGVAISRRLSDGAGALAVLLRRRQLGRRHGARCVAAASSSPATHAIWTRRARLRATRAGHTVDGRRHGASLSVVSLAQRGSLRSVAPRRCARSAPSWRAIIATGSSASRGARRTASASAFRSSGARTT